MENLAIFCDCVNGFVSLRNMGREVALPMMTLDMARQLREQHPDVDAMSAVDLYEQKLLISS